MNIQRVLSILSLTLAVSTLPAIAAPTGYQITSSHGSTNVKPGQKIPVGQPVITRSNGVVSGRLHNLGVRTTQYANSILVLDSLRRSPLNGWQAAFTLKLGVVDLSLGALYNPESHVIIRSREGITKVTGTKLSAMSDGQMVRIGVARGTVETASQGVTVRVHAGKYTEILPGRAPSPPKTANPLDLRIYSQNPLTVHTLPGNTLFRDGVMLTQPAPAKECDRIKVVSPLSAQISRWYQLTREGKKC
jgi:hypothetical protein